MIVTVDLVEEDRQITEAYARLQLERERLLDLLDANNDEIKQLVDRRIRWRQAVRPAAEGGE